MPWAPRIVWIDPYDAHERARAKRAAARRNRVVLTSMLARRRSTGRTSANASASASRTSSPTASAGRRTATNGGGNDDDDDLSDIADDLDDDEDDEDDTEPDVEAEALANELGLSTAEEPLWWPAAVIPVEDIPGDSDITPQSTIGANDLYVRYFEDNTFSVVPASVVQPFALHDPLARWFKRRNPAELEENRGVRRAVRFLRRGTVAEGFIWRKWHERLALPAPDALEAYIEQSSDSDEDDEDDEDEESDEDEGVPVKVPARTAAPAAASSSSTPRRAPATGGSTTSTAPRAAQVPAPAPPKPAAAAKPARQRKTPATPTSSSTTSTPTAASKLAGMTAPRGRPRATPKSAPTAPRPVVPSASSTATAPLVVMVPPAHAPSSPELSPVSSLSSASSPPGALQPVSSSSSDADARGAGAMTPLAMPDAILPIKTEPHPHGGDSDNDEDDADGSSGGGAAGVVRARRVSNREVSALGAFFYVAESQSLPPVRRRRQLLTKSAAITHGAVPESGTPPPASPVTAGPMASGSVAVGTPKEGTPRLNGLVLTSGTSAAAVGSAAGTPVKRKAKKSVSAEGGVESPSTPSAAGTPTGAPKRKRTKKAPATPVPSATGAAPMTSAPTPTPQQPSSSAPATAGMAAQLRDVADDELSSAPPSPAVNLLGAQNRGGASTAVVASRAAAVVATTADQTHIVASSSLLVQATVNHAVSTAASSSATAPTTTDASATTASRGTADKPAGSAPAAAPKSARRPRITSLTAIAIPPVPSATSDSTAPSTAATARVATPPSTPRKATAAPPTAPPAAARASPAPTPARAAAAPPAPPVLTADQRRFRRRLKRFLAKHQQDAATRPPVADWFTTLAPSKKDLRPKTVQEAAIDEVLQDLKKCAVLRVVVARVEDGDGGEESSTPKPTPAATHDAPIVPLATPGTFPPVSPTTMHQTARSAFDKAEAELRRLQSEWRYLCDWAVATGASKKDVAPALGGLDCHDPTAHLPRIQLVVPSKPAPPAPVPATRGLVGRPARRATPASETEEEDDSSTAVLPPTRSKRDRAGRLVADADAASGGSGSEDVPTAARRGPAKRPRGARGGGSHFMQMARGSTAAAKGADTAARQRKSAAVLPPPPPAPQPAPLPVPVLPRPPLHVVVPGALPAIHHTPAALSPITVPPPPPPRPMAGPAVPTPQPTLLAQMLAAATPVVPSTHHLVPPPRTPAGPTRPTTPTLTATLAHPPSPLGYVPPLASVPTRTPITSLVVPAHPAAVAAVRSRAPTSPVVTTGPTALRALMSGSGNTPAPWGGPLKAESDALDAAVAALAGSSVAQVGGLPTPAASTENVVDARGMRMGTGAGLVTTVPVVASPEAMQVDEPPVMDAVLPAASSDAQAEEGEAMAVDDPTPSAAVAVATTTTEHAPAIASPAKVAESMVPSSACAAPSAVVPVLPRTVNSTPTATVHTAPLSPLPAVTVTSTGPLSPTPIKEAPKSPAQVATSVATHWLPTAATSQPTATRTPVEPKTVSLPPQPLRLATGHSPRLADMAPSLPSTTSSVATARAKDNTTPAGDAAASARGSPPVDVPSPVAAPSPRLAQASSVSS
ncbi:hypothetical protein GGF31_000948 [Allomyces arbusculus]|nr:hypothetical protein GGF31_000948 [Allomyces arbusculus]